MPEITPKKALKQFLEISAWGGNCEQLFKNFADINKTDNFGNSLLYNLLVEKNYIKEKEILQLLMRGAKYIRNNVEEKTALHVIAAIRDSATTREASAFIDATIKNALNSPAKIDVQDLEQGKTPLHYAITLQHWWVAEKLIAANANYLIPDNAGLTAYDYAILSGNVDFLHKMSNKGLQQAQNAVSDAPVKYSPLLLACYSGNVECYEYIKSIHVHDELDKAIIDILSKKTVTMNDDNFKTTIKQTIKDFSPREQLKILAAIHRMLKPAFDSSWLESSNDHIFKHAESEFKKLATFISEYVKSDILPTLTKNTAALPKYIKFGLELEFAQVPEIALIPNDLMKQWFSVNFVDDDSVRHNIFMPKSSLGQEMTSKIIASTEDLQLTLFVVALLHEAGAMTNKSTGMHIHNNIIGGANGSPLSITTDMQIPEQVKAVKTEEDIESMLVKQILSNWLHLEPLLQGFIRGGDLYDTYDSIFSFAMPIAPYIPHLLKCENLSQLVAASIGKCTAVNLQNLVPGKHGTVEFRMHEGTIDPVLIEAWFSFIQRLVSISVRQVEDALAKDPRNENKPKALENIEDLVYILLAERDYNKTWDKDWKAPKSAAIKPAEGDRPLQVAIQDSILYAAFQRAKAGDLAEANTIINKAPENEKKSLQRDLERMLKLVKDYPGILVQTNNLSSMKL